MPRIPIISSTVDARSLQRGAQSIDAFASPDAFGAGIGRAAIGAGQQVQNLGEALMAREDRKRDETVANAVAQSDFTRQELEVKASIGPDGKDLQAKTLERYDAWVDDEANKIDDDQARQRYRLLMQKERNNVSARAVTTEFALDAEYSKQSANASLEALQNKILSDPAGFDTYIEQGHAVLDTRTDIPAYMREAMKRKYSQDSAAARFTGMLEQAKTVADIDAISAELVGGSNLKGKAKDDFAGRDWQKEFDPQQYEAIVNTMGTARKAIATKADADARAAIDTIEERAKDVTTLIGRDELKAIGMQVKQSGNPVTIAKYARIVRDQDIIRETQKLPAAEQRAIINGAKGDPGTAHPGVPPRVSNAINDAASRFDVSAGYLATTTQREYGQYYTRERANIDTKFAPATAHSGVDLRNVRPDVADAATVAGQLFGAPLVVTSGYRSQGKQDAIRRRGNPNRASVAKHSHHTRGDGLDFSTMTADGPMSGAQRAKMVGALVDAGFTGIGEYDTHVHADFRGAVPDSFGDRDGKTWGGWTYLSPEVAAALKERGFGPSASAKALKRGAPVQYTEDIDYGKSNPASSATGVMQFTDAEFLRVMRDNKNAARIGVDTNGMTDKDILALRADPGISIMAGAALAERNKRTLEDALNRTIDDSELYMAHFLGDGGAMAFLKARDLQPDQSAAKLLPKAAAANKTIFYEKDGKERTVGQVYNELARTFVSSPSKVTYDDVQTRERVLANTEKQLKDNPVQHAQDVGSHDVPEFNPDNMEQYGAAIKSIADYYSIPVSDMNVLKPDDLANLKKQLDEGNADETLALLKKMQELGPDVATAAFKQLGQKDNVYGYASSLAMHTNSQAAGDIIRGQKRINENPSVVDEVGQNKQEMTVAFRMAIGGALDRASPKVKQDVQDAALAHYVETVQARGRGAGQFDQALYEQSVQAVMGGTPEAPMVAEVNGIKTVLPQGLDAPTVEAAMENMTVVDWSEMSTTGTPPRQLDGALIPADVLADEAQLRAIGGSRYMVQLDDGTFAVTGNTNEYGAPEKYVMDMDVDRMKYIANRGYPGQPTDKGLQSLIEKQIGQDGTSGMRSETMGQ